jgi:hypothetical protein
VLKDFFNLIKNKIFLISLLIVNTVTFIIGFVLGNINLMLLSVASYAAILLSIELNHGSNKEDDG